MATTNIRWAAVLKVVTLLRASAALTGVQVSPGWPGESIKAEAIWCDNIRGDMEIALLGAGRKQRDDTFRIPLEIKVSGKVDLDAVALRLGQLIAAVEDVLADDPTLGALDGIQWAEIGEVQSICGRTPDGPVGFAEVVLEVHSRLT